MFEFIGSSHPIVCQPAYRHSGYRLTVCRHYRKQQTIGQDTRRVPHPARNDSPFLLMKVTANPQYGVVDHLVAVRMYGYGFRHDLLDLVRHHAELAAMATRITEFGLVVEQVEAHSKSMGANSNDILIGGSIPRV
jgi:hypothetical protein